VIPAEAAIRAWVNANHDLMDPRGDDDDRPIARGAYLRSQRSPADGPYLVLSRDLPGGEEAPVAEPSPDLGIARIVAQAFAGTELAAETAAVAYFNAVTTCTGRPQPCGGTGIVILGYSGLSGPASVAFGPDSGEMFGFQVVADFLLADYGNPTINLEDLEA
jgi:hypothetical protein